MLEPSLRPLLWHGRYSVCPLQGSSESKVSDNNKHGVGGWGCDNVLTKRRRRRRPGGRVNGVVTSSKSSAISFFSARKLLTTLPAWFTVILLHSVRILRLSDNMRKYGLHLNNVQTEGFVHVCTFFFLPEYFLYLLSCLYGSGHVCWNSWLHCPNNFQWYCSVTPISSFQRTCINTEEIKAEYRQKRALSQLLYWEHNTFEHKWVFKHGRYGRSCSNLYKHTSHSAVLQPAVSVLYSSVPNGVPTL